LASSTQYNTDKLLTHPTCQFRSEFGALRRHQRTVTKSGKIETVQF